MLQAMLEVRPTLRIGPRQSVEHTGANEIVPRRQGVVAMEEEEDDEDEGGEEMGGLEDLVVSLPSK